MAAAGSLTTILGERCRDCSWVGPGSGRRQRARSLRRSVWSRPPRGGRMLRFVVTFGYRAFPIGPATIGTLIGQVSIRHAMAWPVVLSEVLVGL